MVIYNWVIDFMTAYPMKWVYDVTWYSSGVLFWHLAENVVGLVGCCLPTYRPLLKRYVPALKLGSSNARSDPSNPRSADKRQGNHYIRQQDDEFPLSEAGWRNGRMETSITWDEEHALEGLPANQIMMRTEFRSELQ